jgi:hypothetical protein
MKTKQLSIAALALAAALTACNSGSKTEVAASCSVELSETVDSIAFTDNIESISLMNLQMDDDWVFIFDPHFVFSDNYMYMFENYTMKMLCFDKRTGEKISSRAILGNGPGEIVQFYDMFCIGDNFCVYDEKHIIRQYNSKGAFLGKMHECDDSFSGYNHLMRLKNGDYAFFLRGDRQSDSVRPAILLTDESFNIKSRYFAIPQSKSWLNIGYANPYFANDDIVRFFLSYDTHLYALCDGIEQNIELILPNPLTVKIANSLDPRDSQYFDKIVSYDGNFSDFGESGRFLVFQFKMSGNYYLSMLDKRTNNVVSKAYYDESQSIIARLFDKMYYLSSDGKYLYGKYFYKDLAALLENLGDQPDERLQKTKAELQACLERNADYIKGLEPEELGEASILAKIKLKD